MPTTSSASARRWRRAVCRRSFRSAGSARSLARSRRQPLRSTAPPSVAAHQPAVDLLAVAEVQMVERPHGLERLHLGDRQEIYLGLRALLVTRPEERPI